jgi:hypothetical protein
LSTYTPAESTALLADFLGEHTFRYTNEIVLHQGIATALGDFDVEREFKIDTRSRIDFLVNAADGARIGIEVKVAQSAPEVERQCRRYLDSGWIDGLVLVTTRRRHKAIKPERFDKPLVILWLGRSGF